MVSGLLCWIFPGAGWLLKSHDRRSGLIYFSDIGASGTVVRNMNDCSQPGAGSDAKVNVVVAVGVGGVSSLVGGYVMKSPVIRGQVVDH